MCLEDSDYPAQLKNLPDAPEFSVASAHLRTSGIGVSRLSGVRSRA